MDGIQINKPLKKKRYVLKEMWQAREDYLFMLPFLVLFFIFTVLPVVVSIFLSFTYFNVLEPPTFNGLQNYFKLFLNDDLFMKAVSTTLIIALVTGPIGYILSLGLGWLVSEFGTKTRAFLTLLFYAPSLSGGLASVWMIIFSGDQYGLLNGVLMDLNLIYEPIQWLTDETYMMGVCIIVIVWGSLGTSFLSFVAGFQGLDRKLFEAGAVDGIKNRFQELWYITLPSMKPQMMFGAVMSITNSFGVGAVISQIFGFPSTGYALYTLVHELEDYGSVRFEMGYASAIATLLFLIMIFSNKAVQKLLAKVGQ